MKAIAPLLALALLAACDPGQFATLTISPARLDGSDSVEARTKAIVEQFAKRYQLDLDPGAGSRQGLYYKTYYDIAPGDPQHMVTLRLMFERADSLQLRVGVSEFITASWGPRGDSLRHELADTLRARLGPDLVRKR